VKAENVCTEVPKGNHYAKCGRINHLAYEAVAVFKRYQCKQFTV